MPLADRRWLYFRTDIIKRVYSELSFLHELKTSIYIYIDTISQSEQPDQHLFIRPYSTIEVFVSNKTELYISDPDDDDAIEYDLGRSSDRIEATCTAFGGSPIPTFKWYVHYDI